jgi:hypothetical protein
MGIVWQLEKHQWDLMMVARRTILAMPMGMARKMVLMGIVQEYI